MFAMVLTSAFAINMTPNARIVQASSGNTGTPDTSWYNVTDTEFEISTADELAGLSQITRGVASGITLDSFAGKTIILANDIDISVYGAGTGWNPIYLFAGTFDGNGKTISGLAINISGGTNASAGLFSAISNTVTNLAVEGQIEVASGGQSNIGGIASFVSDTGKIENCSFSGTIECSGTTDYVGGIAGRNNGKIINCYTTGTVQGHSNSGTYYVGGITGNLGNYGSAEIKNCYSTASVKGNSYSGGESSNTSVGGIVGIQQGGSIINCVALNATILWTKDNQVGRIVGSKTGGTLSNNFALNTALVPSDEGLDKIDGLGKTKEEIGVKSFFQNIFDSDNDPWTYARGYLPGLFGESIEMPAHLDCFEDITDDMTITAPSNIIYGEALGNLGLTIGRTHMPAQMVISYYYQGTMANGESYGSYEKPADPGTYTVTATIEEGTVPPWIGSVTSDAFSIARKTLTWYYGTVQTKTYDGTNTATATSQPTLNGVLYFPDKGENGEHDAVTVVIGTITFDDINAGSGKSVTATGYGITGDDEWKYISPAVQPTFSDGIISKANHNMSTVVFTHTTVTYNGEAHSITASGLPTGVTVLEYIGNGQTAVGTYTITVKFQVTDTNNYNVPADMTASLIIAAADATCKDCGKSPCECGDDPFPGWAIASIIGGAVILLGGGFALYWFVFRKKKLGGK